jgi:hypothetical protein
MKGIHIFSSLISNFTLLLKSCLVALALVYSLLLELECTVYWWPMYWPGPLGYVGVAHVMAIYMYHDSWQ